MSEDKTMVQQCFSEIGKRFSKMERSLKRLPYDAELEYVELQNGSSQNFQVVEQTDTLLDISTSFYLSGNLSENSFVVGPWNGNSGTNRINVSSTGKISFWTGSSSSTDISATKDEWIEISYKGSKIVCGSNVSTKNRTFVSTPPNNFYIRSQLNSTGIVRCRSVIISKYGIPLIDAIPVRIENIGYFYDRVNNLLSIPDDNLTTFPNSFIPGPDK